MAARPHVCGPLGMGPVRHFQPARMPPCVRPVGNAKGLPRRPRSGGRTRNRTGRLGWTNEREHLRRLRSLMGYALITIAVAHFRPGAFRPDARNIHQTFANAISPTAVHRSIPYVGLWDSPIPVPGGEDEQRNQEQATWASILANSAQRRNNSPRFASFIGTSPTDEAIPHKQTESLQGHSSSRLNSSAPSLLARKKFPTCSPR